MGKDQLLLAVVWAAYCFVHSALIAHSVTGFFRRALGGAYRFYRLFYNLFSLVTLILLIGYTHSPRWNTAVIFAWDGYLRVARWTMLALGVTLFIAGGRHYSMLQFLGIQQLRESESRGAMTKSGEFDSSGVLNFVRHPWYTAVFLLLWAQDLNLAGITVNAVLSAYLVVGTVLEERKLVMEFGDQYLRYQNRVSMFVPLKWFRRHLTSVCVLSTK